MAMSSGDITGSRDTRVTKGGMPIYQAQRRSPFNGSYSCFTCASEFPTKAALFAHLNAEGHFKSSRNTVPTITSPEGSSVYSGVRSGVARMGGLATATNDMSTFGNNTIANKWPRAEGVTTFKERGKPSIRNTLTPVRRTSALMGQNKQDKVEDISGKHHGSEVSTSMPFYSSKFAATNDSKGREKSIVMKSPVVTAAAMHADGQVVDPLIVVW